MAKTNATNPTEPKPRLRVLFADDEDNLRELMQLELPRMGHDVVACSDGREALEALASGVYDAAILDIQMPHLTGIQVLEKARSVSPHTEFIILTGHATVDTAVDALRHGALDYLTKPCRWAELKIRLAKIAQRRRDVHRTMALETQLAAAEGEPRLIGDSEAMQRVRHMIRTIGPTESNVLILGPTGTGKELVAKGLHDSSGRSEMPFVPVNCGALPEHLVESELFGHRKGAFTGADQHRKGLFEVADGGTLFLDEVGELDKSIQVKLLRFLEAREIRRVGENEPFQVDVRVVCATNRNLAEMAAADEFRQDLYYRINTFEIHTPPLAQRRSDITELVGHLIARKRSPGSASIPHIQPEVLKALQNYHWPGNIRELANVVEHAQILSAGGAIELQHLPHQILQPAPPTRFGDHPKTLRELELDHIQQVLDKHSGKKPAAAEELGISLKTLYNKMNQLKAG